MPFSSLGRDLWKRADEAAGRGASVSELVRLVEKMAEVEIR
jgi:hypothetical protein